MKKRTNIVVGAALVAAIVMTAMTTGCVKDRFDRVRYDSLIVNQYPVDHVDGSHTWNNLSRPGDVTVRVSGSSLGTIRKVQLLSGNPYESQDVKVIAERYATNGDKVTLYYTLSVYEEPAYVAAVSDRGDYTLAPCPAGGGTVTFDSPVDTSAGTLTEPRPLQFTYLFEEDYPEAGDFDYNDIVLRISLTAGDALNQVRMNVTLEAVGSTRQLAGAIRLANLKYDDLESVELEGGVRLDADYPLPRYVIDTEASFMRGLNDDAVINLFEDAHWAMLKQKESTGSIMRKWVNTSHATFAETEFRSSYEVDAQTVTYLLTFKDAADVAEVTLGKIDPFIIVSYNGGLWEVHTFQYKYYEALKKIYNGSPVYDDNFAWALMIPRGEDFQWTIEGMPLGTYVTETGEYFGAYNEVGHSFADWCMNRNKGIDWFLHPNNPGLLY